MPAFRVAAVLRMVAEQKVLNFLLSVLTLRQIQRDGNRPVISLHKNNSVFLSHGFALAGGAKRCQIKNGVAHHEAGFNNVNLNRGGPFTITHSRLLDAA